MKLSQKTIDLGPLRGFGKLGLEEDPSGETALRVFAGFISSAIGLMTVIAIIWFTFVLFTGAIGWISSGGDKAKLEGARQRIVSGLTGLVVAVAAIFIISLIGQIIGIEDILNIGILWNRLLKGMQ